MCFWIFILIQPTIENLNKNRRIDLQKNQNKIAKKKLNVKFLLGAWFQILCLIFYRSFITSNICNLGFKCNHLYIYKITKKCIKK